MRNLKKNILFYLIQPEERANFFLRRRSITLQRRREAGLWSSLFLASTVDIDLFPRLIDANNSEVGNSILKVDTCWIGVNPKWFDRVI